MPSPPPEVWAEEPEDERGCRGAPNEREDSYESHFEARGLLWPEGAAEPGCQRHGHTTMHEREGGRGREGRSILGKLAQYQ